MRVQKFFSASKHEMKLWMFGISFGAWVILVHIGPYTAIMGWHYPASGAV